MNSEPELVEIYDLIPNAAKQWNWGAFLLGPFWALGNRVWIGTISLVPILLSALLFLLSLIGYPLFLFISGLISVTVDHVIFLYVVGCIIFYILSSLILGIRGGVLSWKNNIWKDFEEYRIYQQYWMIWGFALGLLVFFSFIISVYLITFWSVHMYP